MKRLYDILRGCAKEKEVKAEFCKFFKMKIFAWPRMVEERRVPLLGQGSAQPCRARLPLYSLGFLNPDVEYFK